MDLKIIYILDQIDIFIDVWDMNNKWIGAYNLNDKIIRLYYGYENGGTIMTEYLNSVNLEIKKII